MEVAKSNLAVFGNRLMDSVGVLHYAVVHVADTVRHIGLAVQRSSCIYICKAGNFGGDLSRSILSYKLGGLNTVHHKPQFIRLKLWLCNEISMLVRVVFNRKIEVDLETQY